METVEEMNLAYIELSVTDTKRAAYVLSDKCGLGNFKIMEDRLIRIYDKKATVQDLTKALAMNEVDIAAIGRKAETLEDYFLKITAEADK